MSEPVKNPGQQPESYASSGGSGSIPGIHRLITSMHGENYWFNGCAKYVMEALGEPDYDYWFFAGLTGDNFAQVFAYDHFRGDGVTDYRLGVEGGRFIESIFGTCGYASAFATEEQLCADKDRYLRMLTGYIDRGIPVIRCQGRWDVFVGYEDNGQTLLYMKGDNETPERIPLEKALPKAADAQTTRGWIFVGEKKEHKDLRQIYRDAIRGLPKLLTTKAGGYCFGAGAFRAWADTIESGIFDGMKQKDFNAWFVHNVYVCNLATNSGGCKGFMDKAQELNPDFTFLEEVRRQYRITGLLWNSKFKPDDGFAAEYAKQHGGVPDNLEDIGGGLYSLKLKNLQNPKKRAKIAATIRKCADCMDEAVRIIEQGVQEA